MILPKFKCFFFFELQLCRIHILKVPVKFQMVVYGPQSVYKTKRLTKKTCVLYVNLFFGIYKYIYMNKKNTQNLLKLKKFIFFSEIFVILINFVCFFYSYIFERTHLKLTFLMHICNIYIYIYIYIYYILHIYVCMYIYMYNIYMCVCIYIFIFFSSFFYVVILIIKVLNANCFQQSDLYN